jgi:hypothetical protein
MRVRDSGGRLTLRIFQCKKPVIGANGLRSYWRNDAVADGFPPGELRHAGFAFAHGIVLKRRRVVPAGCGHEPRWNGA